MKAPKLTLLNNPSVSQCNNIIEKQIEEMNNMTRVHLNKDKQTHCRLCFSTQNRLNTIYSISGLLKTCVFEGFLKIDIDAQTLYLLVKPGNLRFENMAFSVAGENRARN